VLYCINVFSSGSAQVRMRMLGNVKFIGELFAEKMLNEKIILQCIKRLLDSLDKDTIEVCM
jgi:hypothetical protein